MKADLHCHTLKIKSGDSEKRNVSFAVFAEKTKMAGVELVAITNHNHFDYEQYSEFQKVEHAQVWPGIELDVKGPTSNTHCVVIVNPEQAAQFYNICKNNINNQNPDTYSITIDDMIVLFENIECIYIVHYNKSPEISAEDIKYFSSKLTEKDMLFLEPSNLQSAGIMIAHGYNTLIGSDVSDWEKYERTEIPELKMPIKNFEMFYLLLKKNPEVIKTFVDAKHFETVTITPFSDFTLRVGIYNDVNVFIGGKGTGKTIILQDLEKYFKNKGNNDVVSYYGNEKNKTYDEITKLDIFESDIEIFNLEEEEHSLDFIHNWKNVTITTSSDYYKWKQSEASTKSRNFGFSNATFNEIIDEQKYKHSKKQYKDIVKAFELLNKYDLTKLIPEEEVNFQNIKEKIITEAENQKNEQFARLHGLKLEEFTITKMKRLFTSKKATHTKPTQTGLLNLFVSHNDLKNKIELVKKTLSGEVKIKEQNIGALPDKGRIYIEKTFSINPDNLDSNSLFILGKSVITYLRKVKSEIFEIADYVFSEELSGKLTKLKDTLNERSITSLESFLGVKGKTKKGDGNDYNPSSGERSMLILSNVLSDDTKNIYIFDEPELSVGNVYVNEVIIPRVKDLARNNKKIIIATHDANIGVRTLPFTVIYREDKGDNIYKTFIGNPFQGYVKNIDGDEIIDWTSIAMRTLEGGKTAFIERDTIYGKEKYFSNT